VLAAVVRAVRLDDPNHWLGAVVGCGAAGGGRRAAGEGPAAVERSAHAHTAPSRLAASGGPRGDEAGPRVPGAWPRPPRAPRGCPLPARSGSMGSWAFVRQCRCPWWDDLGSVADPAVAYRVRPFVVKGNGSHGPYRRGTGEPTLVGGATSPAYPPLRPTGARPARARTVRRPAPARSTSMRNSQTAAPPAHPRGVLAGARS
jgi:hypothetical protein